MLKALELIPSILWNAVEEMRARRDTLKTLRSVLLGDILTDGGLSQFERALWELQVSEMRPGTPRSEVASPHSSPCLLGGKSLGTKKPCTQRG